MATDNALPVPRHRNRYTSKRVEQECAEEPSKKLVGLRDLPQAYLLFASTHIFLAILGAFWSNRTYHRIFAVAWPIITIGYLSVTTLAAIAT